MKKCIHIYGLWSGPRRQNHWAQPMGEKESLKKLKFIYEVEKMIDHGVPTDTLLINSLSKETKEHRDFRNFLNSIDGQPNGSNGIIKILERKNHGIVYGAHSHAFDLYKNDYEYWSLSEDEQVTVKSRSISRSIKMLTNDPDLGFICNAELRWGPQRRNRWMNENKEFYYRRYVLGLGVTKEEKHRAGHIRCYAKGANGVTHRDILLESHGDKIIFYEDEDSLIPFAWKHKPYNDRDMTAHEHAERVFTRLILNAGYKISVLPEHHGKGDPQIIVWGWPKVVMKTTAGSPSCHVTNLPWKEDINSMLEDVRVLNS